MGWLQQLWPLVHTYLPAVTHTELQASSLCSSSVDFCRQISEKGYIEHTAHFPVCMCALSCNHGKTELKIKNNTRPLIHKLHYCFLFKKQNKTKRQQWKPTSTRECFARTFLKVGWLHWVLPLKATKKSGSARTDAFCSHKQLQPRHRGTWSSLCCCHSTSFCPSPSEEKQAIPVLPTCRWV